MGLYSLESPTSINRVSGQVIVPDTSYLIPLRIVDHEFHNAISDFHKATLLSKSEYFINVTIRHEQLRDFRERQVIQSLTQLVANNPRMESRYRSIPKFKDDAARSIDDIIEDHSEFLLKHHIRSGDDHLVRRYMITDILTEYLRFESSADLIYVGGLIHGQTSGT